MASLVAGIAAGGVPAWLQAGGTILSTAGTIATGQAAKQSADFEAAQIEQRAQAEQATASYRAEEEQRQKRLVQSRARAAGAASGGGVSPMLAGAIEEEGMYRSLVAQWEGDEAAAGLRTQAKARRTEGRARRAGSYIDAGSTLLGGMRTLYDDYSTSLHDKYA